MREGDGKGKGRGGEGGCCEVLLALPRSSEGGAAFLYPPLGRCFSPIPPWGAVAFLLLSLTVVPMFSSSIRMVLYLRKSKINRNRPSFLNAYKHIYRYIGNGN